VLAPVRQDGGGAETRRAARKERKQKTAVLQGAARPQAVKRSRARETRRRKKRDPRCMSESSYRDGVLAGPRKSADRQAGLVPQVEAGWSARGKS
jgi:hypothetical protein